MQDAILIRYADLSLKGKNKKRFVDLANQRIKEKITHPKITYTHRHDRLYLNLNGVAAEAIIDTLKTVPGLLSFSVITAVDKDIKSIQQAALKRVEAIAPNKTIKVDTKRADKTYPQTSLEVTKAVADYIFKHQDNLKADMYQPDDVLNIEIRKDRAFVYIGKIKGLEGFPVGSMGKGIALLSGGIDSPVAAYLAIKKGVDVELMHFESSPLTSIEAAQKAIDLAKKLAPYHKHNRIILHMMPFAKIHETIMTYVPKSYHITIMRRMMVRAAEKLAELDHTPIIINGESIGQVASQTLESMKVTDKVIDLPIIRPLAMMEKHEIITLAKKIDTYKISIKPFEDCCTIYVPTQVTTNPRDFYANRYEYLFDYDTLIDAMLKAKKTLTIHKDDTIDLTMEGLSVQEALSKVMP